MGVAVHLDLVEPVFNMSEGFFSRYVIDKKGTDSTAVIRPRDRSKILLPSSIPYLQLDVLFLNRNGFGPELNSNRYIMGSASFALYELKDDTGLADAGVTDDDELEQVVVGVHYVV